MGQAEDGGGSRPAAQARKWAPFLVEVRRRVKADLAARRSVLMAARAAITPAQQIKGRIRKRITGDEDKPVRDFGRERLTAVRERLHEPPVIQLRDKVSFMFGVLGCGVIEAVVLVAPERFWLCYAVCIIPLLALRAQLYKALGWQYFLLDFCYASNLACLVHVFVQPQSELLLVVNFLLTTGPLAMAIPTWRNSLVFHSLDKVTSAFIHMLPPLLTFTLRWHPYPGLRPPDSLRIIPSIGWSLAFYASWQVHAHGRATRAGRARIGTTTPIRRVPVC